MCWPILLNRSINDIKTIFELSWVLHLSCLTLLPAPFPRRKRDLHQISIHAPQTSLIDVVWEFLHNLKALLLFGWHQCWLWTPWRLWVVSDCPLNEKRQLQEPIQDWHLTGCTIEGLICEACLVNTFKNVVKCLGNENSWLALLVQNYFITKAILKLSLVLDWLLEIVYILEFILAGASFELLWQCRDGKSGKINYLCCTAVKLHEY